MVNPIYHHKLKEGLNLELNQVEYQNFKAIIISKQIDQKFIFGQFLLRHLSKFAHLIYISVW